MRAIDSPLITTVRGKGLLNAVVIKPFGDNKTAYDVCLKLKDAGLLDKLEMKQPLLLLPPPLPLELVVTGALALALQSSIVSFPIVNL